MTVPVPHQVITRTCPVCGEQITGICHLCPGPPGQEPAMPYDPSADVAELIEAVRKLATANAADGLAVLGQLMTGPWARLTGALTAPYTGGIPRQVHVTEQDVREAFAEYFASRYRPGKFDSLDGHALSDEQIRRHGRDRYPTAASNYRKVLDEAGELGEALIERAAATSLPVAENAQVRREYADTGLALFALGRKLGIDLNQAMRELVERDTRDFR